jgi:hypothetical protein
VARVDRGLMDFERAQELGATALKKAQVRSVID